MTTRLYYTDPLLTTFDATVVSCEPAAAGFDVALDQTAFYPTSGGQPFDTGRLGAASVIEVVDRDDGSIAHLVDAPLAVDTRVLGQIDWARRFDHMQQHTGQHVLSAAFDRLCGVRTTSFHLGADASTIDLAREVTAAEVAAAEDEACRIVWEDRPVEVRFVSEEEARALPLRKESLRTGELRLVEIEDFDLSACGGTHVPTTGRIGIIAVAGRERFKGASRITFVCGGRALRSHGRLRDIVEAASRSLSVSGNEVPDAVARLGDALREANRHRKVMSEELAGFRAAHWASEAETIGAHRVVLRHESDSDAVMLKTLASAIVKDGGRVAVLVGAGEPRAVVAARSSDVAWDAGAWIKQAAATLGGRGGGRPELAQAGIAAPAETILALARESLAPSPGAP
ncbi:MAG TPA: DHHA1 domain-containing protein [Vicinamibacterales bacterium]|nr:DHHA1 domain-containing protein [Vicinamibacterales bacterium]